MTPEQILSEEVFTIHARPKTGAEHIAALAEAGYRIVPVVDDETREDVLDAVRHAKENSYE